MTKINVLRIVNAHFRTLRDAATGAVSGADLLLFVGAPFVMAALATYFGWALYVEALNALLAAFAIFAGLLLNLLLLIFTFSSDTTHPLGLAKVRAALLRELHDNIAFSVLLSIAIVVVCFVEVAVLRVKQPEGAAHSGGIGTFVIVFLTANFVLTLLMVLKRIYTVFNAQLDKPAIKKVS